MHRRLALSLIVTALASVGVSATAIADERGTKEEAIKMVNTAFDHIKKVGEAKAFDDFTKDKANWVKKDLYVFVLDDNGAFLAHERRPTPGRSGRQNDERHRGTGEPGQSSDRRD